MNILFVTPYPPVLHQHGGGVRMFHNIRILSQEHSVRVFSFVENDEEAKLLRSVESICDSVTAIRRVSDLGAHWFSVAPFLIREFGTPAMHAAVDNAVRTARIDVIQCEYLQMAQYKRRGIPSILTIHEPYSPNAYRAFETASDGIEKLRMFCRWMATLNYEISMCNAFDRVVAMTNEDADFLRSYSRRANIRAIPIGVDVEAYGPNAGSPREQLPEVVFIGNYRHTPNLEAAEFLAEEIAPHFPGIRFVIAGSHLPEGFVAPENVAILGHVADTRTLFRSANTMFAAPLFSGTGQRVKLLEAFAMEAAVITTPLGVAGFPVVNGEQALIADSAPKFRAAIERLSASPQLRCRLGRQARQMVVDHFTWNKIGRRLLDLVVECGAG